MTMFTPPRIHIRDVIDKGISIRRFTHGANKIADGWSMTRWAILV